MDRIQAFINQYNKVFDEQGNVKACGREACMDLINMCKVQEPSTDFGNPLTGMMNVENIQKFRKKSILRQEAD